MVIWLAVGPVTVAGTTTPSTVRLTVESVTVVSPWSKTTSIAGDGPMQGDLFPILEYAAPRAFFMGTGTRMLEGYDERTRRMLLAPTEKNAVLHSLPPMDAQHIFTDFSTINGELFGCLFNKTTNVPCIFQTLQTNAPAGSEGTILDQAELAFANGYLMLASQIVSVVLKNNPANEQVNYLSRVFRRERHFYSQTDLQRRQAN